jgi:hypothetical protein
MQFLLLKPHTLLPAISNNEHIWDPKREPVFLCYNGVAYWYRSWLVLRRGSAQISAETPATLTQIFRHFPQPLQETARILPQLCRVPFQIFWIRHLRVFIILPFDCIGPEMSQENRNTTCVARRGLTSLLSFGRIQGPASDLRLQTCYYNPIDFLSHSKKSMDSTLRQAMIFPFNPLLFYSQHKLR